jgi:hypothetical protein
MRTVGLLVLLGLGTALVACKGKGDADAAPDPAALKAQQDLLARRDKLLQTRQKLESDRDKLDLEIKDIEAKGGDASEQKKQKADLDNKLENSTAKELTQLDEKLDQMKQTGDKAAQVAVREADLANRERALAEREARLADRERQLVQRDSELAQRWKDTCTTGTPVIIQQSGKAGGNYSKRDVSDLIAKAKNRMSQKGILVSDLPGPAQSLEGEASKAMNANDMSKAYFAAAQLAGTVDSIQINRPFIQAKMARVQAQIKRSKPDSSTNQQLSGILSEVIQKFGDGDFAAANRRLNHLVGMLK